jgi:hypothetical protein
LILLLASPAEAKCHIYRIWHYPKPQRCFTAYAVLSVPKPQPKIDSPPVLPERITIPIPDMAADWGGGPVDERLQAIAKLRGLSEGR